MTKKKVEPNQQADRIYNIKGGIHAGRDVVQGNQTNIIKTENIQTLPEFITALQQVQAQITELKQQPLTSAQRRNVEIVEGQVTEVVKEVQKPKPLGERVKTTLAEAKETMELLGGSIAAAATLGTTIGGLAVIAIRLFGG